MVQEDTRIASLRELQDSALEAISAISSEVHQLINRNSPDSNDIVATIHYLSAYMSDRCKAVSMLVSWDYCWDAEIVLRSMTETWAKIVFICYAEEEQEQLVAEYWADFEKINDRRTARKAQHAADLFAKYGETDSERVFLTLARPGVLNDGGADLSKAQRKAIEQKWSFAEIIESLSARDAEGLSDLRAFLHMYGMASHLIHADKTAMDLMIDRIRRPEPERAVVSAAQAARIMSDQVSLWYFVALAISKALNAPLSSASGLAAKYLEVRKLVEPFMTVFAASQREFYDEMDRKYPATPA